MSTIQMKNEVKVIKTAQRYGGAMIADGVSFFFKFVSNLLLIIPEIYFYLYFIYGNWSAASFADRFTQLPLYPILFTIYFIIIGVSFLYRITTYSIHYSILDSFSFKTNNINLRRHFRFLTGILIANIVMVIIGVIGIFILGPMEVSYEIFIVLLIIFGIVILIFPILIAVFRIISFKKLNDWGEQVIIRFGLQMIKLRRGTTILKWGQILTIIPLINFISPLIIAIGFITAGNTLNTQFKEIYNQKKVDLQIDSIQPPSFQSPEPPR